jgi:hypothetical protein
MVHAVNSQNRPDMPVGKESKESKGGCTRGATPEWSDGERSVLKHRGGG